MKRDDLKSRIAAIMLGHTADLIMTKGYTWLVVTTLMAWLGPLSGTILNLVFSFLLCLATMKFYDWAKVDWLGLEMLKSIREDTEHKNVFTRFLSWSLRRGDWLGMLGLALVKDAFFCTAWMRKGAYQYNGMKRRDWVVFITTLFISTFWESFYVYLTVVTAKGAWQLIK